MAHSFKTSLITFPDRLLFFISCELPYFLRKISYRFAVGVTRVWNSQFSFSENLEFPVYNSITSHMYLFILFLICNEFLSPPTVIV